MSTSTNEAIYRRLIEEGFNQGNLAVCDEIVAAGALEHQRGGELVAVGDKVWARQRGGGTNIGSFAGQPPTGKTAFIDVIDIARFENGKMVEHWGVADQLGMMQALGLMRSPAART